MKNSRKYATLSIYFALAAACISMAGCAASPKISPEEQVRQRATQRVQLFIKGDTERLYGLMAPSYRKLRSLDLFKRSIGGGAKWETAEVASVSCEPERCKVALAVAVKPLIAGKFGDTISVQFEEIWLLEDGNWWLYQKL